MQLVIELVAAFFATLFFGFYMHAPKRCLTVAAALGMIGQFVYALLRDNSMNFAAFCGTFVICVFAEVFARVLKTPTTVISFVSIIPLVPGVMLYKTMLCFVENDLSAGATQAVSTLLYTGSMAIAITIATVIGKHIVAPLMSYNSNGYKKLR